MFEAKGVSGAEKALQLVVGDVRQPFPGPLQDTKVGVGGCGLKRRRFVGYAERALAWQDEHDTCWLVIDEKKVSAT